MRSRGHAVGTVGACNFQDHVPQLGGGPLPLRPAQWCPEGPGGTPQPLLTRPRSGSSAAGAGTHMPVAERPPCVEAVQCRRQGPHCPEEGTRPLLGSS